MQKRFCGHLPACFLRPKTRPLLLWCSFVQGPEAIGGDSVDGEAGAGIAGAAEKQFAAAVAIGVDGVDQLHAGSDFEMTPVSAREEYSTQHSFESCSGDQGNLVAFSSGSGARGCHRACLG